MGAPVLRLPEYSCKVNLSVSFPFCLSCIACHTYTLISDFLLQEEVHPPPEGIRFVYYETHKFVRSDVTQTIDLKRFGIKIHIPSNSFSKSTLHITIGVGTSENVIIPKNMSLTSAIYYVKPSSKLLHPVIVEMEHCARLTGSNNTEFGITFSKSSTSLPPPYTFKKISNGSFPPGQSWGTIQMSEFSLTTVISDDKLPVTYIASVLSYQRKQGKYRILFIAGKDLGTTRKVTSII